MVDVNQGFLFLHKPCFNQSEIDGDLDAFMLVASPKTIDIPFIAYFFQQGQIQRMRIELWHKHGWSMSQVILVHNTD